MLFFYENLELVRDRKSFVGRLTRGSQLFRMPAWHAGDRGFEISAFTSMNRNSAFFIASLTLSPLEHSFSMARWHKTASTLT
jgi:hypothetical protein